MTWISGIQRVLDYIEENLDGDICYDEMTKLSGSGAYHLQRSFSLLTGMTLTEYIRQRRLTLAAGDLIRGMKVIDTALKYGYDSQDGFARAFARFHGILPSDVRDCSARLNACSPLNVNLILKGGSMMEYKIEHKPSMRLLGIRRRFDGAPFGTNRGEQEEKFFISTRASQWLLRGMASDSSDGSKDTDIAVVTDVNEDGYLFWYCSKPDEWTIEHLYDPAVTGIDFMDRFEFETLDIPEGNYAVFHTSHTKMPIDDYVSLREKIAAEWLPGSNYTLRNAPELAIYHWYQAPDNNKRYIEIWIPVEE